MLKTTKIKNKKIIRISQKGPKFKSECEVENSAIISWFRRVSEKAHIRATRIVRVSRAYWTRFGWIVFVSETTG